jgi:hypothetical protein
VPQCAVNLAFQPRDSKVPRPDLTGELGEAAIAELRGHFEGGSISRGALRGLKMKEEPLLSDSDWEDEMERIGLAYDDHKG